MLLVGFNFGCKIYPHMSTGARWGCNWLLQGGGNIKVHDTIGARITPICVFWRLLWPPGDALGAQWRPLGVPWVHKGRGHNIGRLTT